MISQLKRKTFALPLIKGALAGVMALTAFAVPFGASEAEAAEPLQASASAIEIEPDSWRFQDGVLVNPEESGSLQTFSGESAPAWTKTDQGYVSSNGSIIPGAYRRGIDVSEWQHNINWDLVKQQDVDFAIIRCAVGTTSNGHWYRAREDYTWRRNVSECERLGIPYGLYFYTSAENLEQARAECEFVRGILGDIKPAYPFYLDMERSMLGNISYRDFHASVAKMFADMTESLGIDYGVYANLNWWNNYLTDPVFNNWERWVAQYNTACHYRGDYKLWQCTSSAEVAGIDGRVDLNFEFGGYYRDVRYDDWYVTGGHFDYIINNKIMSGYSGSYNFGPYDNITRGQLACVLHNLEGSPSAYSPAFDDVDYNAYYGDAIRWARATNVVNGFGDNSFAPDEFITREDLCCMLGNYAEMKGVAVGSSGLLLNSKPDASAVSSHARDAMGWAVDIGLVSGVEIGGVSYLMPQDNAVRASVATMVANLVKML